jgi:thiamine kinase-like enzyme
MASLKAEQDRAIERAGRRLCCQLRQGRLQGECSLLRPKLLKDFLGPLARGIGRRQAIGRALLLERGGDAVLIKTDETGAEAKAIQIARMLLGRAAPMVIRSGDGLLAERFERGLPLTTLTAEQRNDCLDKVAEMLSKLHIVASSLGPEIDPGIGPQVLARQSPLTVRELASTMVSDGASPKAMHRARAVLLIRDFLSGPFPGEHPYVLIHGDLHADNILYRPADRSVMFLDWEDLRVGHAEEDLAMLCSCFPNQQHAVLLDRYRLLTAPHAIRRDVFEYYLRRRKAHQAIRRAFARLALGREP